jgi:hypothetical protein
MAQYAKIPPVTLSFTVTFDGVSSGGKCRAVDGSVKVTRAVGPDAGNFDLVVTKWGDLLPIDRNRVNDRTKRKAERVTRGTEPAPEPAPLTADDKAKIPANGTKAQKGKTRPAAEPAPEPAQPDLDALVEAAIRKALAKVGL